MDNNGGGGAAGGEMKAKRMHTYASANTSLAGEISVHAGNSIVFIF